MYCICTSIKKIPADLSKEEVLYSTVQIFSGVKFF